MAKRLCDLLAILHYFYGVLTKTISLKAPGNYSASFWSNKISVLLCEGRKPPTSMISGVLGPEEPLFLDFNIPNYFRMNENYVDTFLNVFFLRSQESNKLKVLEMCVPNCLKFRILIHSHIAI